MNLWCKFVDVRLMWQTRVAEEKMNDERNWVTYEPKQRAV